MLLTWLRIIEYNFLNFNKKNNINAFDGRQNIYRDYKFCTRILRFVGKSSSTLENV